MHITIASIARAVALALTLAAASTGAVHAQAYPTKPVRFVIPFAPGGGNDVIGRIVAQQMTAQLGRTVIVDNRGGAGGAVGSEAVSNAAPDGYTLLMASSGTHAINPVLYKVSYDPVRDFEPVSMLASAPSILVVHPSMPVRTVRDLIKVAKAQPGQLNFASAGTGSTVHLTGEIFGSMAGVKIVHVPYKGSGPALTDLLAGQVQMMFSTMPAVLPHVRSGRLRGLAVTCAQRSKSVPDLPTVSESGVPGYDVVTWYGVMAPARTPPPVITTLHAAIVKSLDHPTVAETLNAQGAIPAASTPAKFGEFARTELGRYRKVIQALRITGDAQ